MAGQSINPKFYEPRLWQIRLYWLHTTSGFILFENLSEDAADELIKRLAEVYTEEKVPGLTIIKERIS